MRNSTSLDDDMSLLSSMKRSSSQDIFETYHEEMERDTTSTQHDQSIFSNTPLEVTKKNDRIFTISQAKIANNWQFWLERLWKCGHFSLRTNCLFKTGKVRSISREEEEALPSELKRSRSSSTLGNFSPFSPLPERQSDELYTRMFDGTLYTDVNLLDSVTHKTPLHHSIMQGNQKQVRALLEQGND